MNLKNYAQLKLAASYGFCISCWQRELVILSQKEFDASDYLMCMNCGFVSNKYAAECRTHVSKPVNVVEVRPGTKGITFYPTVIYKVEHGDIFYQIEIIGQNGEDNNQELR